MKTIINNPYKLKDEDMNKITNKVRALILDENDNILVTKYADIYMLPGGKVDKSESIENGLIRELKEELGMIFDTKELTPFIEFKNYLNNYPLVSSNEYINKLNNTIYYIIKTNKKIDTSKISLTEREKKNCFSITTLKLDEAFKIISNHNSNNPRNEYFKIELLKVLEEFVSTYSKSASDIYFDLDKEEDKLILTSINNFYVNKIINPYKESDKLIDLHAHTTYSDGELSPDELIRYALRSNIGTLAITDHDTIEGIKNVDKNSKLIIDSGIKIINGIELSAKVPKGRMHILGLGIDLDNPVLNKKLTEFKDINVNYVLSIIEQIKKDYNIVFSYEDLKELINANHNLGRPDVARLLVKNGYVKTISEAFDKYLIEAYNKLGSRKKGIPYSECIDLILQSNGIPILAHPNSLELSDKELLSLLKDMINIGLKGIEVYHSSHTKEETSKYLQIANELGLLLSGGSDYHGKNVKPDVELGTGKNNNIKIKELPLLKKLTH